jgi:hypothetical protein
MKFAEALKPTKGKLTTWLLTFLLFNALAYGRISVLCFSAENETLCQLGRLTLTMAVSGVLIYLLVAVSFFVFKKKQEY